MAGPWEEYQKKPAQPAGPWDEYKKPEGPGVIDRVNKKLESWLGPAPDRVKFAQSVDDAMRVGVDAAGLGTADYMAGGNQKQLTDEARERLGPIGSTAVDFTAGSLTPFGAVKNVGRVGRGAYRVGMGGFQGGLDAYTHGGDLSDIAKGAAVGSGAAGFFGGIGDTVGDWMGRRRAAKNLPGDEHYKAIEEDAYKEVDTSGTTYHRSDMPKLMAELQNIQLAPGLDDAAIKFRDKLAKNWGNRDISPTDLDRMRQIVRDRMTKNKGDKGVTSQFLSGMDKFAADVKPTGPTGLPDENVNKFLQLARKTHANRAKVKDIEKAAPKTGNQDSWLTRRLNVGGEGSGLPSRTRFGKLAEKGIGFTKQERDLFRKNAGGDRIRDIGEKAAEWSPLRSAHPFLTTAGSLGGSHFLGGPLGTAVTTSLIGAAEAARSLGKAKNQSQIDEMLALAKTGNPLKPDPKTVEKYRSLLARMGASGGRTLSRRDE